MTRTTTTQPDRLPRLCLHKAKGLAYVTLSGRQVYLGPWAAADVQDRYDRAVAQWLASGRRSPGPSSGRAAPGPIITIATLARAYVSWATGHYQARTNATSTIQNIRCALRMLEAWKSLPAADFGPVRLEAVRALAMERCGWSARTINDRIARIRLMFRWAASRELVPVGTYQGLMTLPGLPVGPASDRSIPLESIDAVRRWFQRPDSKHPALADLVQVQFLTGMRPGEAVIMRPCDLRPVNASGRVWQFTPARHKNSHRGQGRTVYCGPGAMKILKARLATTGLDLSARPLFVNRRGRAYSVNHYGTLIRGACDSLGIDRWGPGSLRHTRAMIVRDRCGLEASSAILGHRRVETTQIYAQAARALGIRTAARFG